MYDANSPLNGMEERTTHPRVRKQIRLSRWLVPIVLLAVIALLSFLLGGCGSWLNDTRAGILTANQALNSYDDIAVEIWKDAPTNPDSKQELGVSLCACYIVQDALIEGWTIATMVDDGLKKKRDFTDWVGNILTVLDALENHIEMSGVEIPHQLDILITYVESMNPRGVLDPSAEPLAQCSSILPEASHKAAGAFPYEAAISETAELALYLLNIIMDRLADEQIPEDALEQVVRQVFRQELLYLRALTAPIGPD